MPIQRSMFAALAPVLFFCALLHAPDANAVDSQLISESTVASVAAPLLHPLSMFSPTAALGQSVLPSDADALLTHVAAAANPAVAQADGDKAPTTHIGMQNITDLRKALLAAAMSLRDIRYVRGGRDPSTGFDCSGFVRYVFAHAIGLQLPNNSASQFLAGTKVKRVDIKPGDLVFFHTSGRHRVSHVGIYISDGRFIHSPTTGKSVEISSLDSGYWAKRFVGAKRPDAMALALNKG